MSGPLRVEALARHYGGTPVFASAHFTVKPGEFVAIVGNSGVGKSTLLNCLAGLDRWDAGRTVHGDTNLAPPDETRHTLWQRAHVGFVFQAFHVLPHLDVTQNMALPRMPQARLVEALRQDQGQWCAGINPAVSTWCFHAI
jgi:putative ABC transport system ATP-binding protein